MTANGSTQPFDGIRAEIDAGLVRHFRGAEASGSAVRLAMRDSVLAPAKRLRPVMTAIAARDLGCFSPAVIRAGCAVELVHTASLLLDDLPCMDDAATRRGRPAAHLRWGEDVAILAAIALLSEAYATVSNLPGVPGDQSARLAAALSRAIGLKGLVAGQYTDLHGSALALPHDGASSVNDQKTGALFIAALDMAAVLAGADAATESALHGYGRAVGRAFQLFDDLLDTDGDPARMGKGTGQDANKATLARRLGRDGMMDLIRRHVAEARLSLRGTAMPAEGLQALTDHIFGPDEEAPRGARVSPVALMPSLFAR